MQNHHIYDLSINSDLKLPADSFIKAARPPSQTLSISYEPGALNEFTRVQWISSRYGGLIRSYDVGNGVLICAKGENKEEFRFHISNGTSKITFDAYCSIAPAMVTNLGLSICKLLQGHVTLHGIGIEMGNKLIGILARSQTGKSTLLWALRDCGARFATDDVLPVHVENGNVIALPSISLHAKLSQDTLAYRNNDCKGLEPLSPDADLFWLPIAHSERVLIQRPLNALFILQPVPQANDTHVDVHRIYGGVAFSLLLENTHGLWAAYSALEAKKMFDVYAVLADTIPIYVLRYVRCYEVLPRLVDAINSRIKT